MLKIAFYPKWGALRHKFAFLEFFLQQQEHFPTALTRGAMAWVALWPL